MISFFIYLALMGSFSRLISVLYTYDNNAQGREKNPPCKFLKVSTSCFALSLWGLEGCSPFYAILKDNKIWKLKYHKLESYIYIFKVDLMASEMHKSIFEVGLKYKT